MFEFLGEIMAQDDFSDVVDQPRDKAFLFFLEADVFGYGLRGGAAGYRMHPEIFHAEFRTAGFSYLKTHRNIDAVRTMFFTVEKPRMTTAWVMVPILPGNP
jgi:hypothetical protein